jgi:DNA-binding CsgD family transcriptional regulator
VSLTKRELEVLRLVKHPLRNGEIASALKISHKTVKGYVSSMLSGLGLRDRSELAIWAVKNPRIWKDGFCVVEEHLEGCGCGWCASKITKEVA